MRLLNILSDQIRDYFVPHCPHKILTTSKPSCPKPPLQPRKLLKYYLYSSILLLSLPGNAWMGAKEIYEHDQLLPYCVNLKIILTGYLSKQLFYPLLQLFRENGFRIFWNPYKMIFDVIDCMLYPFNFYAAAISYFLYLRNKGFHPHPYRGDSALFVVKKVV